MSKAIPVRVGDVDMLLETVVVAGSEPTSRVSDAAESAADAFVRAQRAIVEVAASMVQVIGDAAKRGARPDGMEVEFGLKVSARGNVVVAGAAGEATLRVKLVYRGASG